MSCKTIFKFLALVSVVFFAGVDAYFGKSILWKLLVGIVAATGLLAIFVFTYKTWKKGVEQKKSGTDYVFERVLELAAGFVNRFTEVRLREEPDQITKKISSDDISKTKDDRTS